MPEPGVTPPASATNAAAPPEGGSLIDASAELLQTAVTYVRQETGDIVREKVVLPTQKAGATVALAIGVAIVLVVGIMFIAVGALILLAQWIGWPAALFLIGGLMVVAAGIIAFVRSRSMQS